MIALRQPRLALRERIAAPCSRAAAATGRGARPPRLCVRLSSAAAEVSVAAAAAPALVSPAVLDDNNADFPIAPDRLIELAKRAHATDTGLSDESVLSDNFRFEFPIVKLGKEEYLGTVRSFQLRSAIPDLSSNAYDWRVDPYEPNRVWFTIRTTGTHTGTLKFGRGSYEATGRQIRGAPECCSYTFDADGKVTSFTGGYVMDNRVGNTGGLGAAFGILTAIGVNLPKPNSLGWTFAVLINKLLTWLDGVFGKK